MSGAGGWSIQQLVEFLAAVSSREDGAATMQTAVERAAEALEAEVGALVVDGEVVTSVGFPAGEIPVPELVAAAVGGAERAELPGLGACAIATAPVAGPRKKTMILARAGDEGFGRPDVNLLRGMARVLSISLRSLALLQEERTLRAEMEERRRLHEELAKIEEAIAHRSRLDAVLERIVEGAASLIGDELAVLRLVDAHDPSLTVIAATHGIEPDRARRAPVARGLGGRAIEERELVVVEGGSVPSGTLAGAEVRTAMAVPVHEHGTVVGCLVVGTADGARRYSAGERELLVAFAEHASLALAAAKTIDTMQHAFNDFLTGLANRALFVDRLEHALASAQARGGDVTVIFMDVDRFKLVNDSLGHLAGDELLIAVAERIEDCLQGGAMAARLGGDEFAVLLVDAGPNGGKRVAENIIEAMRRPVALQGERVRVTTSIGIASGRDEAADELLRRADEAMYHAKRRGKDRFEVFEPGMRAEAASRLALEADLQRALDEGRFLLHYQPIVDLASGRTVGAEALVRMRHPQRGMVPPGLFIPLAEETGLILAIGRWVLAEACRQAAEWQAERELYVTVNLSGRQLQQPDVADEVAAFLEEAGLCPSKLVIEITESVLMQDTEGTLAKLESLRSLGVRLAIDDFGTGYSSLGYLDRFPIDVLKVAKPFVDGLAGDSPLAAAVVGLARALGLNTIGEGIEEEHQARRLRQLGCAMGQGYLYARPLESAALLEYVRREGDGGGLALAA